MLNMTCLLLENRKLHKHLMCMVHLNHWLWKAVLYVVYVLTRDGKRILWNRVLLWISILRGKIYLWKKTMSLSYFDNVYIFTFNNCNKKTRILFASLISKVVSAHVSVSYIKKKIFFTFYNCNKKARILFASLLSKVVSAHVSVAVCHEQKPL